MGSRHDNVRLSRKVPRFLGYTLSKNTILFITFILSFLFVSMKVHNNVYT